MKELLNGFSIIIEIPVQWGDMDAARHVNNTVYLRWTESARIAYFHKIALPGDFNSEEGPILGWQDCKYIFPITFPDTVIVGAKVMEIKEDRFMMENHVFSKKHERLAAFSKNIIVPYNYIELHKINVPENWKKRIEEFEGHNFL